MKAAVSQEMAAFFLPTGGAKARKTPPVLTDGVCRG
jgi:hypothetical protein